MTTTIDLPAWLEPAECLPSLIKNALVHRSPFGQSPQTYVEPGEYWRYQLTLPRRRARTEQAAARAAFLNRISGGAVRLRVPHFPRRVPWGTLGGFPVLSATAAAGATTLQISGALSRPNLIAGGDMEVDTNNDGLSDGMSTYSAGSPGTITASRVFVAGRGTVQRVTASAFGSSVGHRVGLLLPPAAVSAASVNLSVGADVSAFGAVPLSVGLEVDWTDSSGAYISASVSPAEPITADFERVTLTANIPAAAATAYVYIYVSPQSLTGPSAAGVNIDRVQVEASATPTHFSGPPSLLAGDRIGVLGQLFEVMDNVELDDMGAGTVYLNNRPRASLASGSAVTWRSPTATMVCAGMPTPHYTPGWQEPIALDLEEVWDA